MSGGEFPNLNDTELLRYSRHILLNAVDADGQARIIAGHVLLIGLGGLGSPVAMYLAAAGVGRLTLVDDDKVELTNLQRQIVHRESRLGTDKVASAAGLLSELNSTVQLQLITYRLQGDALRQAVEEADVVVDCTDNFATRCAINTACLETQTPLVSAAAIRFEGQMSVFDSRREDSPCYQCLYPALDDRALSCSESGVFSPLVGVIGSMQAMETLKLLSGAGEPAVGKLLLFDGLTTSWTELKLPKNPHCPACGGA